MTGIADVYLYLRKPRSKETLAWLKALFFGRWNENTRFVVLSWERTGSNLLCDILYHHREIVMHNDLFNTIDIGTFFPESLRHGDEQGKKWSVLGRDMFPEAFLEHIWTGKLADGSKIRPDGKAVGFKSFPEHWHDSWNEETWQNLIMEDPQVKKIILQRNDELAVFVSMCRAEMGGTDMGHKFPKNLKIHVDPAKFQIFVNNYRDTFRRKYKSTTSKRDTFRITYEQLISDSFATDILPLLWRFLGVDDSVVPKPPCDTIKQSPEVEDISGVISNYAELEFCFRHTDVIVPAVQCHSPNWDALFGAFPREHLEYSGESSWSILIPICSRQTTKDSLGATKIDDSTSPSRMGEVERSSKHSALHADEAIASWSRLERFSKSLLATTSRRERDNTECIIGIDVDDEVFASHEARTRIEQLFPVKVEFVDIQPCMYGKVCRIWNYLAEHAQNDFIVLLGDDVELLDESWQEAVLQKFITTSRSSGLPFGAACVALNDVSFPGFPTFPVIHRWHMQKFDRLLPRQFVNQGGDPFLFELYSRWNASSFAMRARIENTIGGDSGARYEKHNINWSGLILDTHMKALTSHLKGREGSAICLDVVVPSYRTRNTSILHRIVALRSTIQMNVRFWIVVDNPDDQHLQEVTALAKRVNKEQRDGNYFVNVISYGENRGASYARNTGYNYSTADWVLFLDDDVIPEEELLDAYAGAIRRYPEAKVMVGCTTLPPSCNTWTSMLSDSNVMFFYGVANHRTYPPWGVTANLLVRGSRHNHTVQFKEVYPKTGGGEDIDFVFQMKKRYGDVGTVVSVPGARVKHPWWKEGRMCYSQIGGWAWGDSLCLTQWPEKTFLVCPNWVEFLLLFVPSGIVFGLQLNKIMAVAGLVTLADHVVKSAQFWQRKSEGFLWSCFIAVGASTIISCQEIARVKALTIRRSIFSFCRRTDWFDGQANVEVLDQQLWSVLLFMFYVFLVWCFAA